MDHFGQSLGWLIPQSVAALGQGGAGCGSPAVPAPSAVRHREVATKSKRGPWEFYFAELGPWLLTLLGRGVGALGSGGSGVEALLQRRGLVSTCTGEFMDGSCMGEPRPLEEIQRGVHRSVVLTERWWSRGWWR
jgi:hypothetical protein